MEPLYTDRLCLRPYSEADREAMITLFRDPLVSTSFMVPDISARADADALIDRLLAPHDENSLPDLGVYLKGKLIGTVFATRREDASAEVGYAYLPGHWGNGYAAEALRALFPLLGKMGVRTVLAGYFAENKASLRVMEKAGMMPAEHEETIVYRGNRYTCRYCFLPLGLPENVTLRKAGLTDLNILLSMRLDQLREESGQPDPQLAVALGDYYRRHSADGSFSAWLALHNGEVIGTGCMSVVEKPPYSGCLNGRIGLLSGMYTVPNWRRRGVARALLGCAVREARYADCAVVHITASNAGVPLYESFGFEKNANFLQYKLK